MTGNELRRKVADIINAWDGATRGSAKHLEILNIYNNHKPLARGYRVQVGDAHCATTASAAYIKAGIAEYTGTECGVGKYVEIAKKKGIWTENDAYTPKVGDACVYDWQDGANYATTDNTGSHWHCYQGGRRHICGHRGKHERRQGGQAHHESERAVYPRFHYPGL